MRYTYSDRKRQRARNRQVDTLKHWRKVAGEVLLLLSIGALWSMLFVYGLFTII